jgi:hypothetical protein
VKPVAVVLFFWRDIVSSEKKRRQLEHRESVRLLEWMKANVGLYHGPTSASREASKALGFDVSPSSVEYWLADVPGFVLPKPSLAMDANRIASIEDRLENIEAELANLVEKVAAMFRASKPDSESEVIWTGAENAPV